MYSNYKGTEILKIEAATLKDLEEAEYIVTNFEIEEYHVINIIIYSHNSKLLLESIGNLSKLQKLYIHNTDLMSLPESIGNLSNLEVLSIHNNKLKNLHKTVGKLSNLRELDISKDQFETFPDVIENLSNLSKLYINNNQIKFLPEFIGKLSKLQEFSMHDNEITEIPKSFSKLSKLIIFSIHNNQLKNLPDSIGELLNLQELDCSNNQLEELPQTFGNFSYLRHLYLENNLLKNLLDSIGTLKNLEYFNINNNQLRILPVSIGNLKNLKTLSIHNNQLRVLPESISNLSNLEELDISKNQLEELPNLLGNLSSLQHFNAGSNKLKFIPESIIKLSNLQYFNVDDNELKKLTDLPENLKIISLNKNFIDQIPSGLQKFPQIKKQIEDSFNFPLVFDYFPNNYLGDNLDDINSALQKKKFAKLYTSTMKFNYWKYIINYKKITPSKSRQPWTFYLYRLNPENKNRVLIRARENAVNLHLKHPFRKKNFLQFQCVIKSLDDDVWKNRHKYLVPLIRSITLMVETDRGDIIPLIFTDFYYNMVDDDIEFQSKAFLKFDSSYALEPFARLKFIDLKIDYHTSLMITSDQISPNKSNIFTEINKINKKIDRIIKYLEYKSNSKLSNINELKKIESKKLIEEEYSISENILNEFQNSWEEPLLPNLILKIGKGIGSWLGKYVEYLAAGVIVAGIFPAILQFLYRIITSSLSIGIIEWLSWDLSIITIPVWFEILSYIPLLLLFLYLSIKFFKKQKITKK